MSASLDRLARLGDEPFFRPSATAVSRIELGAALSQPIPPTQRIFPGPTAPDERAAPPIPQPLATGGDRKCEKCDGSADVSGSVFSARSVALPMIRQRRRPAAAEEDQAPEKPAGRTARDRAPAGPVDRASAGLVDRAPAGLVDRASAGLVDRASAGLVDRASAGPVDRAVPVLAAPGELGGRAAPAVPRAKAGAASPMRARPRLTRVRSMRAWRISAQASIFATPGRPSAIRVAVAVLRTVRRRVQDAD